VVVGDGDVVGANHVTQATVLVNRIPNVGSKILSRQSPRLFVAGTTRNERVDYGMGSKALAVPALTLISYAASLSATRGRVNKGTVGRIHLPLAPSDEQPRPLLFGAQLTRSRQARCPL